MSGRRTDGKGNGTPKRMKLSCGHVNAYPYQYCAPSRGDHVLCFRCDEYVTVNGYDSVSDGFAVFEVEEVDIEW